MKKKVLNIYKGGFIKFLKKNLVIKNQQILNHIYSRIFPISQFFFNNFLFIHKGYLFVYRYILKSHLRKKLGELAVTRKPLVKPLKNNK